MVRLNNRKETWSPVYIESPFAIVEWEIQTWRWKHWTKPQSDEIGGMGYYRALVLIGRAAIHLTLGDIAGANDMLESPAKRGMPLLRPGFINWQETQAQLRDRRGYPGGFGCYHAAEMEAGRAGYTSPPFFGHDGCHCDPRATTDAMEVLNCAGDRTMGPLCSMEPRLVAMRSVGKRHGGGPSHGDRILLLKVLLVRQEPVTSGKRSIGPPFLRRSPTNSQKVTSTNR